MAGTLVPLDRERPVTIGHGEDCVLRLQDPGIAPQHAVVKALRDQGFGVKALAPGLRLNGAEIEAAPLQQGDVLEVGTTRLSYDAGAGKSTGPTITGYRILGELGRGGMGTVYLAEQQSLHRQVALKVLDHKLTRDPQFVARFVAEARAAAKLGHPNVVHVFDVDQDQGTYYYSMELMHHGSLEAWLRKNGKMPVERALQVIADAGAGLAYAESLGIVHRDIKPDNLMLDQHGTVKIADLGLAFTEQDPDEKLTGTPHFMAPEQVLRKGTDHRTDLYALGCTFYRLITGRTPFRGQTVKDILRAHVREEAEPVHKIDPAVPADVAAIIQKLMAKEPADRYQSAEELVSAVSELLQPPMRKGLWIALAAAAVVVAGGAIYWAVTKPKEKEVVQEYIDNPEAARLAQVNKQLERRAREDAATIALLRARLDAGEDLELAAALDGVVAEHEGTAAAEEARALAETTRAAVAERQATLALARRRAEEEAATIRTRVEAALETGELPRALALATGHQPPDGADADTFAAAMAVLRQDVLGVARQRTTELRGALDRATAAEDVDALRRGAEAIQRVAAVDGGWPEELVGDRETLLAEAKAATETAAQLEATRQRALWDRYAEVLHRDDGVAARLTRADFAGAADQLDGVPRELPDTEMAQRARQLAGSLRRAAAFGDAIAAAITGANLQLVLDGETPLQVTQWNRGDGVLVLVDTGKRPPKESQVTAQQLSIDQWEVLARQVEEPPELRGGRTCFLAFLALQRHLDAARAYLQRLKPGDDQSGLGDAAYPLGASRLDLLLQNLPRDADWAAGIRSELQAGQLLAKGLRALSERRNRAAAAHVDRAIAEHAHSLCVSGLP